MIYLTDGDRLIIIAGCLGFLALCLLIMVCKLSPHCFLHKYCPFRPKYEQEYKLAQPDPVHYRATSDLEQPPLGRHPPVTRWRYHPGDTTGSETEDGYSALEEDKVEGRAAEGSPTATTNQPFPHRRSKKSSTISRRPSSLETNSALDYSNVFLVKGEVQFSMFYPEPEEHYQQLAAGEDDDDQPHIRHQTHYGHLNVRIRSVTNLIFRKRDKVKLSIKIQLLKEENGFERVLKFFQFLEPEEQVGSIEHETQTSLKSVHKVLEWDETKLVPLARSEAKGRCLRLVCCLYDRYSQCTNIGETIVNLHEITFGENEHFTRPLTATVQECTGELLLSLSYLPTSQKLVVKPVECRQLKLIETQYPSSVYIRVALITKGTYTKKKTRLKDCASRVTWNDPVNFELPGAQLADVSLLVTVKQAVTYSDRVRDHNIGKLVVGMVTGTAKAQRQWKAMLQVPREPQTIWHSVY